MATPNGTRPPLERAHALVPEIIACADQIDRDRELPASLVDALIEQGLFRLLVPKAIGGEEMDFVDYLAVVGVIAEADGSVGWCLNQGAVWATSSVQCAGSLRALRPLPRWSR